MNQGARDGNASNRELVARSDRETMIKLLADIRALLTKLVELAEAGRS